MSSSSRGMFRALLMGLALALGATSCWLCGNQGPEPPPYNPKPGEPLTIDVHAHVVNGQDVPIYGFVRYVFLHDDLTFGAPEDAAIHLLEDVIHFVAPGYAAEAAELCGKIHAAGRPLPPACSVPAVRAPAALARKRPQSLVANPTGVSLDESRAYLRGRLQDAILRAAVTQALQRASAHPLRNNRMKGALRPLRAPSAAATPDEVAESFLSMFGDLVRDFSSWRLNNLYALERLYPDVGIFVGHLLDFDKWLYEASPVTPVQQNELATLLAIASDGRFMSFVGFDPWRDVSTAGAALAAVQDAVEQGGAVGVKLYPPMGFQVSGNPPALPVPGGDGLGTKINASLAALFEWCDKKGVPILVHTGATNYAPSGHEDAEPKHWADVLGAHPNLRINLSHIGGQTELESALWEQETLDLLAHPHVYGDVACLDPKLSTPSSYWNDLKAKVDANPVIAQRLLYGSDWFLLSDCASPASFEKDMRTTLTGVVGTERSVAVFGNNAVDFIGLRRGQQARERLEAFYRRYGVAGKWRYQVDAR
jgi:predicted TIM-barrel fold metal-dependent hydrolase